MGLEKLINRNTVVIGCVICTLGFFIVIVMMAIENQRLHKDNQLLRSVQEEPAVAEVVGAEDEGVSDLADVTIRRLEDAEREFDVRILKIWQEMGKTDGRIDRLLDRIEEVEDWSEKHERDWDYWKIKESKAGGAHGEE